MNKLNTQNFYKNQRVPQQTLDSDKAHCKVSTTNKQSNFASQRHYSSISESSKEDIPSTEMLERTTCQTHHVRTNSGLNAVKKEYSKTANKLLEMPTTRGGGRLVQELEEKGRNIAKFVVEVVQNQRIDFPSIADTFCKKIDRQSNSDTTSAIAYSLIEMVNTGRTDIASEIIINMVDNGRVDTAARILCSIKLKDRLIEIGKILGRIVDNGRFNVTSKIICLIAENPAIANNKHRICRNTTRIATLTYIIIAIAKENKIDIAAEIINRTLCVSDATKVLAFVINGNQAQIANNVPFLLVNEGNDARTKLLSSLASMKCNSNDQTTSDTLKLMLLEFKEKAKTKIIKDINSRSYFGIADMIVEILNKNDIGFAFLIFQAIDQKRRPDVLSAMDPESRRTLYNILKKRNML